MGNRMVFFSGTDWEELEDNAPNHNYYLSVIVNNKLEIVGKLCYILDVDYNVKALDDNGQEYTPNILSSTKTLVVYDCKIIVEGSEIKVEEDFKKQTSEIIEEFDKNQQKVQFLPH